MGVLLFELCTRFEGWEVILFHVNVETAAYTVCWTSDLSVTAEWDATDEVT